MKNLKKNLINLFKRYWSFIFIVFLISIFFWKYFIFGEVPIPSDIVIGTYFPWLDYKWGYEIGVPVKNPILSDVVSVIYPLRSLLIDQLISGKSILWNPLMFTGYPLLANFQIAVFSPTTILYFLLPKIDAWTIQIILQPILASVFTYILLRHFKASKIASLFGGIFYAFSGFNLIWMEWNAHSLTSAWIPLLFYLLDKYILEKKIKYLIFTSITIAFQILSGYPQIAFYTLICLGFYVIIKRKIIVDKVNFKILLFIILGVLLTSIQLIPIIELISNSQRITETISNDLMFLPWKNIIAIFAPDYFGNHATANFWGEGNYTNNVIYSGLVTFVLMTIGLTNYKKKFEVKYLFFVMLISLIISLPFGFSKFLFNLGIHGSKAASATRLLLMTNFSVALLSGFGIDLLLSKKNKAFFRYLLIPFLFLFLVLSISSYNLFVSSSAVVIRNMLVGLRNLIFPFLIIFVLFISFYVLKLIKTFKIRLIVVLTICLLGTFELFRFGWKYTSFSDKNLIFPETPIISFLKNQEKPFRVINDNVISKNMWVPYGIESPEGYDAVYPKVFAKYLGVLDKEDYNSPPLSRYGFINNFKSPLIDLLNVKYILLKIDDIQNAIDLKNIGYKEAFSDKSVLVYENNNYYPRAFAVYDWEVISDETKTLNQLLDPNFNFSSKVILEKDPKIFKTINSKYQISFEKYDLNNFHIKLESEDDGILFISNAYYPGWEAYIDGDQVDILRADFAFQSIVFSKGYHDIVFIYNPKSFRIGKLITSVTLVILLVYYLYDRRKK